MLNKDDHEHLIPMPQWATFREIADAFAAGNFRLRNRPVARVLPISSQTAAWMAENLSAYGDSLGPLDDRIWDRSIYRWMGGYWAVLLELSTFAEPVSDLTLHAKLYETGNNLVLAHSGVFVP